MKTLLTVIVCGKAEQSETQYDGIQLIYREDEGEKDFLDRAAKAAKGKYSVVCEGGFSFSDVQSLMKILDKNTSDMVCFTGGAAYKTSVFKNAVKECEDIFSSKVITVLGCKNLLKTVYTPFIFDKFPVKFKPENEQGLLLSAETFGKVKAKLSKEIYSYASDMLCDRLVIFYMYAMIAVREGDMPADRLITFDGKIKAEIVLHLALEKRFTAAKLQKLRLKSFKISRFTAKKFYKLLNK